MQNIGLTISPWVSAQCLKTSKQDGYFWLMMYYSGLACVGIVFNVWLYIDDLRNRGGILDAVDTGENLNELMTTPTDENKRRKMKEHFDSPDDDDDMMAVEDDEKIKQDLLTYKQDKNVRDSLKRSVGKKSMQ